MADEYKVTNLQNAKKEIQEDDYYLPKVSCPSYTDVQTHRYINLDEQAIDMLIAYYSDKQITIDGTPLQLHKDYKKELEDKEQELEL